MQDKAQLRSMLEANGLSRLADTVEGLMMPSIRLILTRSGGSRYDPNALPEQSPIGASKIGGDPDLPPDFEWPLWEGIPISFVAQFNLADVSTFDVEKALPQSGMLYFFYDVTMEVFVSGGERVNWKVIHYNGDLSSLSRTPAPPDLPGFGKLDPCTIAFRQELTVPNSDCVEIIRLFEEFSVTEEEREHYWRFIKELIEYDFLVEKGKEMKDWDYLPRHRLLGCPDVMYNDGRAECVAETQEEPVDWEEIDEETREILNREWTQEALNWRLLFQIDTDDEADLNWGDAGLMFFFIHKEDLQAADFENVGLVYEGH